MSDNCLSIIFIFFNKIFCTRKGNLIDIFINFLSRHPYAPVRNRQCFFLFINADINFQLTQFAFELAHRSKRLQLLGSIYSIRHQFTQKNLVVTVQKFLNYGENIITGYPNTSFCHIMIV